MHFIMLTGWLLFCKHPNDNCVTFINIFEQNTPVNLNIMSGIRYFIELKELV